LDGFVGEALQDDAGGPSAKGGFDFALAFDVANIDAFAAALGGHATAVEVLGDAGECNKSCVEITRFNANVTQTASFC